MTSIGIQPTRASPSSVPNRSTAPGFAAISTSAPSLFSSFTSSGIDQPGSRNIRLRNPDVITTRLRPSGRVYIQRSSRRCGLLGIQRIDCAAGSCEGRSDGGVESSSRSGLSSPSTPSRSISGRSSASAPGSIPVSGMPRYST